MTGMNGITESEDNEQAMVKHDHQQDDAGESKGWEYRSGETANGR